jgi:dUTP pyrophosphatase
MTDTDSVSFPAEVGTETEEGFQWVRAQVSHPRVRPIIKFKKVCEEARIPERATDGAAAYDIYYPYDEPITVYPTPWRTVTVVPTGIAMEIPTGWKGEIYSRSGLATKGIFVVNQPGKIDSDYRGEIKVLLYNSSAVPITLAKGARIAQFELNPTYDVVWEEDKLSESPRGESGLGSTGE